MSSLEKQVLGVGLVVIVFLACLFTWLTWRNGDIELVAQVNTTCRVMKHTSPVNPTTYLVEVWSCGDHCLYREVASHDHKEDAISMCAKHQDCSNMCK